MQAHEIEALERSVVAGVAPREVVEIAGWLVPLDDAWTGRAKSAVPLRHDLGPEAIEEIEQAYVIRGLPPRFRVADVEGLAEVRAALAARGYGPDNPTVMKVGPAAGLAAASDRPADVLETPDEGWASVFMGPGFDPEEGASRVASLSRSAGALYGAVREAGQTLAVGCASFGHGWAGLHGMRTSAEHRRRGLARRIMAGLGRAMLDRGVERCALQVQEPNEPARALYRGAGFQPVWRYEYWRR